MGVMDIVRQRLTPVIFTPRQTQVGPSWDEWLSEISTHTRNSTPAGLFAAQPHLYTVVTFLARNVAQLGLHSFERVSETDRRRDRSSDAARALAVVDGTMTTYDLIFATVGDLCLYDRAYWFVGRDSNLPSGWMIRRIPPSWVSPVQDSNAFEVSAYRVAMVDQVVDVPADQILSFGGYSPASPSKGSPAVEALRGTLSEQVEAAAYRAQVWKRGGRVSSVLQRPADAPQWDNEAREAFRSDWYAKYTGRGPKAGGTPILEDGMTLNRIDFTAQEQQFVEAAKLSLVTVAAAFHVNPTMIGQNDGANYSNVREFRRMLYGDTLGPLLARIEARINAFLLPMLGVDATKFYVEFNIAEKLQGSFEEQVSALQSAVGAPWMARSEARALMNLPAIADADGLVTPLNVIIGGQASPTDSGTQNERSGPLRIKAAPERARVEDVIAEFFERQKRAILSRLGSKSPDWWDGKRWDSELTSDLLRVHALVAGNAGRRVVEKVGAGSYDEGRTLAFLREASARSAASINEVTRNQVKAAIDAGEPVRDVMEASAGSRVPTIAATVTTFAAGFGAVEAARQNSTGATKTWIVTSSNPRASHAAMDGETVGLDDDFSNGLPWPGAAGSDADEVAGCQCEIEITIP